MEIYVDDEAKLTLHGLVQHYIMLNEEEKNRKLNELLDNLEFNQVCLHSQSTSALSLDTAILMLHCCIELAYQLQKLVVLQACARSGRRHILIACDCVCSLSVLDAYSMLTGVLDYLITCGHPLL